MKNVCSATIFSVRKVTCIKITSSHKYCTKLYLIKIYYLKHRNIVPAFKQQELPSACKSKSYSLAIFRAYKISYICKTLSFLSPVTEVFAIQYLICLKVYKIKILKKKAVKEINIYELV